MRIYEGGSYRKADLNSQGGAVGNKSEQHKFRVQSVVHDVLRSPGRPMDSGTRNFMESRFGYDFSQVRVHTDIKAVESADALRALAYTVGDHIVFAAEQYAPRTNIGNRLLAHELTHTIQQGAAQTVEPLFLRKKVDYFSEPDGKVHEEYIGSKIHMLGGDYNNFSRLSITRLSQPQIQCQPSVSATTSSCATIRPQECVLYEDWLGTFATLPTFQGQFIEEGVNRDRQQVIGEREPLVPHPPQAPLRGNTRGIERPWVGWLRENLPPALIETAYELPSDCADIVLILRHVWLAAHGRTERVGRWTLGRGVNRERIESTRRSVSSRTLRSGWIAFYRDANGNPIRSYTALLPLLHPGDALVWEHRDAQGGGHSETIESISFNPTVITTIQGNLPVGRRAGWRLERGGLDPDDLHDMHGIWTWSDRTTVLIGAGPWGAGSRPSSDTASSGTSGRVLQDWSSPLSTATISDIPRILEGAMGEVRAALEGQRTIPAAEAEGLGEQIGRTLRRLMNETSELTDLPPSQTLIRLLHILEAYRRATRVTGESSQTIIDEIYVNIRTALEASAGGL